MHIYIYYIYKYIYNTAAYILTISMAANLQTNFTGTLPQNGSDTTALVPCSSEYVIGQQAHDAASCLNVIILNSDV